MRGGGIGNSPNPAEPRFRISGSFEDTNKRRFQRSKDSREVEKPLQIPIQERSSRCKLFSLKLVLVIITCCTFLMILLSPTVYLSTSSSRPSFVERWIWERSVADPRYVSKLHVNWEQVLEVLKKITHRHSRPGLGLLNFNYTEVDYWKHLIPDADHVILHLDYVRNNLTWESLYPEWIDEEEESEIPVCPSLSTPKVPENTHIDVIAVKLPCQKSKNWSRDVARLHLQLAAARLAASVQGYHHSAHVLFVTDCFPNPNVFTCKELVGHKGNAWLYKPNLSTLREKLRLPVGSCELAVPLKVKERIYSGTVHKEAYATILHSAHVYVCGAIAAAQSIRMVGSTRDLVILVDDTISEYHRGGLEAAGWKIRTIERIRNPKAEKNAYNEWNYSKF